MAETLMDGYIQYAKSRPGPDVYYRDSWECYYFSLLGKCFGMLKPEIITLKGVPEDNLVLREQYEDVTPGYYANKLHWNSIALDTKELTPDEIKAMIKTSHDLVYAKLTKKQKSEVDSAAKPNA